MKAWWLNALLATAVLVLGLVVYLKPPGEAAAGYALTTLKPEEVNSIRIERAGAAPIAVEKKLGAWRITAPLSARADPARVKRVLELAEARASSRLAPADLARYELNRPQVLVALGTQRFDFGMINPISHEQYVLTGDAVYTVSPRHGASLPAGPADLADKRLFAEDEVPVRIGLKDFSVARPDGKWRLDPSAGDLSQDDLQQWIDEWRLASAVRVTLHGQIKPSGEIDVQLRDGRTLTLAILAREPELALLRPDENLVYYFLGGQAQRLLTPPGAVAQANSKTLDAKTHGRQKTVTK